MIKYFSVKNFRSIKEENILEFDMNLRENTSYIAHSSIGFAGSNASGKSNVLQALSFVLWFMQNSFHELEPDDDIPCQPFLLSLDEPSQFHLIFEKPFSGIQGQISLFDDIYILNKLENLKTIEFEYLLVLQNGYVIEEKLNVLNGDIDELIIYQRKLDKVDFNIEVNERNMTIPVENIRNNCSIISYAAQFKTQKLAMECKNYSFESNLTILGLQEYQFKENKVINILKKTNFGEKLKALIKIADIGVSNIESKKSKNTETLLTRKKETLYFQHQIGYGLEQLTSDLESTGTLQFITILLKVLTALEQGSVIIIDEIELKLHQSLVAYLIGLFQNPVENPKGAQLIFSFHNSFFMEILEPEQLWFAEKDDQGKTNLFCAADFKESIKDLYEKDLETLYRVGRFGARPREL